MMTTKAFCALLTVVALPPLFEATTGCSFTPGLAVAPNSYVCSCDCEPGEHHREIRVSAALDDAEQSSPDADDLDLGLTLVGVRFAGVDVPQGAGILSASVQFTADNVFGGSNAVDTNLDIYAIAADDVPSFSANTGVNLGGVIRTAAAAGWPIPPWSVSESGPAELTPNLKDIVQELVDRPGWQSGNALALIFAGVGRREAESFDGNPARAAVLSIDFLDPVSPAVFDLYTCVPPIYDGNLLGGMKPTEAQLSMDCTERVQPTISALDEACGYPSVCSCNVVSKTLKYAGDTCDTVCAPTAVDAQCTNFDPKNSHVKANTVDSEPPICTAYSPLAADLFGRRTTCEVNMGTAHIKVGDNSADSATTGVVQFDGNPCPPGQSCPAGMEYNLDFGDVKFGNFFGSETFTNLAGLGESGTGSQAVISPSGDGTFAPSSLDVAGQGSRGGGDLRGLVTTNDEPIDVNVGWNQSAPKCKVQGTLVGSVDPELKRCAMGPHAGDVCDDDTQCADQSQSCPGCCQSVSNQDFSIGLDVAGDVVNQPPTAEAGPDQTVECTAAAVTNVVLDGSGSTDADGNITVYSWLRGNRVGDEVGSAPISHVQQPLGSETYVLRVIDTYGQADESTTEVNVVDTKPPVLSCSVMTPVLYRANHDLVNVGLMAGAVDQCEGALPVTVNVYANEDDEEITGDGNFSPDAADVDVGSLRLRAERKGNGDGRVYLIVPEATDSSGNRGFSCCTVTVPHSVAKSAQIAVSAQAAAARAFCLDNDGTPPDGYSVVGDGPVIGPKQ